MRIGIGLPSTVAGAGAAVIPAWSRLADAGPFASICVHDRLLYDSIEPLTTLAAAAAVTSRVELACLVAIAPLRPAILLAKQARSLDALAGQRLALGLGLGPRPDDYEVSGVPYPQRGRIFERQLADLRRFWRRTDLGPHSARLRPKLLLGGGSDAGLMRLARYADGYVHNGGSARAFRAATDRVLAAWSDSGRPGRPEMWGLGYFGLGPAAAEEGRRELLAYYAFAGGYAGRIAAGMLDSAEAVRTFAREYVDAGCDHLMLFPTVARLDQVERLAEVVASP